MNCLTLFEFCRLHFRHHPYGQWGLHHGNTNIAKWNCTWIISASISPRTSRVLFTSSEQDIRIFDERFQWSTLNGFDRDTWFQYCQLQYYWSRNRMSRISREGKLALPPSKRPNAAKTRNGDALLTNSYINPPNGGPTIVNECICGHVCERTYLTHRALIRQERFPWLFRAPHLPDTDRPTYRDLHQSA